MTKHSNSWHKTLYGDLFAKVGLDSSARHKQAQHEVDFLINKLELKRGSHILDVPCGTGRHTLAFAKRGFAVTGVDISESCLKLAKKNCRNRPNAKIIKGDMKNLRWANGRFDVVTNLFSSFGYFKTNSENKAVLKGFKNALKPGGCVVIQTINRDWLLKIFDPARWGETPEYFWQEGAKYDPVTKYVEAHRSFISKKTGKGEVSYNRMRVYSISEMKKLMRSVGLTRIRVYGDISGRPAQKLKSTHPIYIGYTKTK